MATTVLSLIERVNDLLDNYGSASTTLGAAVTSTTATTFQVADQTVASAGDWVTVDGETVEVTAVNVGPPTSFTVRRGMRGSTAATHLNAAVVRVNLDIIPQRVVNALNLAQASAYPQLACVESDTSLTLTSGQYEYEKPGNIDHVRQVWVAMSTSGQYAMSQDWDMSDAATIRVYAPSSGRGLRIVGTSRFKAVTYSGSLDGAYPAEDPAAIGYLVYEASANLISEQQLQVSKRDGFKGITDAFAEGSPTISLATGERYRAIAQRLLRQATRNITLPMPTEANPQRFYLQGR